MQSIITTALSLLHTHLGVGVLLEARVQDGVGHLRVCAKGVREGAGLMQNSAVTERDARREMAAAGAVLAAGRPAWLLAASLDASSSRQRAHGWYALQHQSLHAHAASLCTPSYLVAQLVWVPCACVSACVCMAVSACVSGNAGARKHEERHAPSFTDSEVNRNSCTASFAGMVVTLQCT